MAVARVKMPIRSGRPLVVDILLQVELGLLAEARWSCDVSILKLDANGNVVWQKTYGRSNYDMAYSIQQTSDNGYIVAGKTWHSGEYYNNDVWVLKLGADGDIEWQKEYGGRGYDVAKQ